MTDQAEHAQAVAGVLAAVLRDAEHDIDDCFRLFDRQPILRADSNGEQFSVCPCGMMVEVPGGIEVQMRARGLAPDTPPVEPSDPVRPGLTLVDPTEIYTPEDLEQHLLDVVGRLESGQLFERECIEAEYTASLAWELAKAKTIATAGGAADVRAAKALTENQAEYEAWQTAQMMRKATQAAMHNLRSVLSGYQSVAKSVLTTYQVGGSPGPANQKGRY